MFEPVRLAYLFYGCCGGMILGTVITVIVAAWWAGTRQVQEAQKIIDEAQRGDRH